MRSLKLAIGLQHIHHRWGCRKREAGPETVPHSRVGTPSFVCFGWH